jgi:hypothetical protein
MDLLSRGRQLMDSQEIPAPQEQLQETGCGGVKALPGDCYDGGWTYRVTP